MSQTISAIREDGMYPDQVAQMYQRAAEKIDEALNFSDLLKAERAVMQEERQSVK